MDAKGIFYYKMQFNPVVLASCYFD